MHSNQWTFIGAGNMASSLIGGLVSSGISGKTISVVDISSEACNRLADKFGVQTFSNTKHVSSNDAVVVAVKPNIVESVCRSLANTQPALLVSVAAGVRSDAMTTWLNGGCPVVRCMPNTPALLGLGATALYANEKCSAQHKEQAQALLATAGKTHWVSTEAQLDAVTALSGSGPAYFFYLIEHMASAGEALGLPADMAREFAIETAYGAASMARTGELSPSVLRENVTSKGGTTAAALATFNELQTPEIIAKAMQAARDRAVQLGDEFATSS